MPYHIGISGRPFPWRTNCCTTGYTTREGAETHEALPAEHRRKQDGA